MGTGTFSDGFESAAIAQIKKRGYPVSEVWARLGVSKHGWKREFAARASGETEKVAGIRCRPGGWHGFVRSQTS